MKRIENEGSSKRERHPELVRSPGAPSALLAESMMDGSIDADRIAARQQSTTRGALAVLAPVHGAALSLVVGSGQGSIARTIATLGGRVVGIDPDFPAVTSAQPSAQTGRDAYACAELHDALPFADGSFDNVLLADRFGALRRPAGTTNATDGGLDPLLAECHRVLRPGGTLVMEAPNRLSFLNFAGKSPVGGYGGRLELLPRALARFLHARRRADQAPGELQTYRGYVRALRRADFVFYECYVPWPDRLLWSRLRTVGALRQSRLGFDSVRRRDRMVERLFGILSTLRVQHWFIPDFIYVARKPSGSPSARVPSVVDLASGGGESDAPSPSELRAYQNSGSVLFEDAEEVVKIPLTYGGQARLWRERDALLHVGRHPVAEFAIRPIGYREEGGVRWVVYPRGRPTGGEARLSAARRVLRRLLDSATFDRVEDTDAWRRLCEPDSRKELRQVGADSLLRELENRIAGKRVPVGLVHGDFALHNVLEDRAGEPMVIDWDRSERQSPVFLDALAASHFHAFRTLADGGWGLDSYWTGWQRHFENDERLPLREEIEDARGELDRTAMIVFAVLNTIQWNSREEGPTIARNREIYRRWAEECCRRLERR